MTKPDMNRKLRNLLLCIAPSLLVFSFGAAWSASFWQAVLDYWLVWTAIFTGVGTIVSGVGALVYHGAYLDDMRSN